MDQVLSARVDPAVALEITRLAALLGTTKKAVLEQAVRDYAARVAPGEPDDVLDLTCGAWERDEDAAATVEAARESFRGSFARRRP